jgi:serine phosphatase RsbU (regulator of sigma subunit)
VAYTDGVIDALNEAGRPFDATGLRSAVAQGAYSQGARGLVDQIEAHVVAHVGDASPFDDITLIAVSRV